MAGNAFSVTPFAMFLLGVVGSLTAEHVAYITEIMKVERA